MSHVRPNRLLAIPTALTAILLVTAQSCTPYDPAADGYHIAWQDDFNSTTLDTATWADNMPWFPEPPAGRITVADGQLHLVDNKTDTSLATEIMTLGQRCDTCTPYHYPAAHTWQGGYFEARLRYTDTAWSWPAFWLFGQEAAQRYPDPGCPILQSEWDMMENRTSPNDVFDAHIHRNTSSFCGVPDTDTPVTYDTNVNLSDWHTYGARWQEGQLCHYIDGNEIPGGCVLAPASFTQPMFLVLGIAHDCQAPTNCKHPPTTVTIDVDWVKVWQR